MNRSKLSLRQRVGSLVLDRVLSGDHHERLTELVGLGVDRDLPLLHGLEERRLGLGARAVDLVAEHDVREYRPGSELEVAPLLTEDVHPRDVGWKQVGGELDPPERAIDGAGDRLGEHRLARAGDVLDQDVSLGHQNGQGEAYLVLLPLDHALDVLLDRAEPLGEALPVLDRLSGLHDLLRIRYSHLTHVTCRVPSRRDGVSGIRRPEEAPGEDGRRRWRTPRVLAGRPARPLFSLLQAS